MSIHRELDGSSGRNTAQGREVFVCGRCECGWEGTERSTSDDFAAHDLAFRDYRAHIEEALGASAYYSTTVACRNCGSEHEQGVLIGTHVTSATCSNCGTRMLQPSNDAWDESRSMTRGWFR